MTRNFKESEKFFIVFNEALERVSFFIANFEHVFPGHKA